MALDDRAHGSEAIRRPQAITATDVSTRLVLAPMSLCCGCGESLPTRCWSRTFTTSP